MYCKDWTCDTCTQCTQVLCSFRDKNSTTYSLTMYLAIVVATSSGCQRSFPLNLFFMLERIDHTQSLFMLLKINCVLSLTSRGQYWPVLSQCLEQAEASWLSLSPVLSGGCMSATLPSSPHSSTGLSTVCLSNSTQFSLALPLEKQLGRREVRIPHHLTCCLHTVC